MVFKETKIFYNDEKTLINGQVIHLYKGFSRKKSKFGDKVLTTIKKFKSKKNWNKKLKLKAVVVRTKYNYTSKDSTFTKFYENSVVLFKKNIIVENYFIKGPTNYSLKKKKFASIFNSLV